MPHLPVILVAHGSPSEPDRQEEAMQHLARKVGALLPQLQLRGATLAAEGALAKALGGAPAIIYPFFMAEGWFTKVELPRRLAALQASPLQILPPFGTDPALPQLMAQTAEDAAHAAGLTPQASTLLLAAHGSRTPGKAAETTWDMVNTLAKLTKFAKVDAGFVEEAPFLATAAKGLGPALCLPFFALNAGHVEQDLPQALSQAGFKGPLLPPIGEAEGVPALIAAALRREILI